MATQNLPRRLSAASPNNIEPAGDWLLLELDPSPANEWNRMRSFFTIWLARLLGMGYSHDLVTYLYREGQYHAVYEARHVHEPSAYVTGAASLANAAFERLLMNRRDLQYFRDDERTAAADDAVRIYHQEGSKYRCA